MNTADIALFDKHFPYEKDVNIKGPHNYRYHVHSDSSDSPIKVHISHFKGKPGEKHADISFSHKGAYENTGLHHKTAHKVLGTVKHIMKEHAAKYGITHYHFTAEKSKEHGSRSSLYKKMAGKHLESSTPMSDDYNDDMTVKVPKPDKALELDFALFDKHFPYKKSYRNHNGMRHIYSFKVPGSKRGHNFEVSFIHHDDAYGHGEKHAHISFRHDDGVNTSYYNNTGLHPRAAHHVLGTVQHIMRHHAKKHGITHYHFSAEKNKEHGSRAGIYKKMAGDNLVSEKPYYNTQQEMIVKVPKGDKAAFVEDREDKAGFLSAIIELLKHTAERALSDPAFKFHGLHTDDHKEDKEKDKEGEEENKDGNKNKQDNKEETHQQRVEPTLHPEGHDRPDHISPSNVHKMGIDPNHNPNPHMKGKIEPTLHPQVDPSKVQAEKEARMKAQAQAQQAQSGGGAQQPAANSKNKPKGQMKRKPPAMSKSQLHSLMRKRRKPRIMARNVPFKSTRGNTYTLQKGQTVCIIPLQLGSVNKGKWVVETSNPSHVFSIDEMVAKKMLSMSKEPVMKPPVQQAAAQGKKAAGTNGKVPKPVSAFSKPALATPLRRGSSPRGRTTVKSTKLAVPKAPKKLKMLTSTPKKTAQKPAKIPKPTGSSKMTTKLASKPKQNTATAIALFEPSVGDYVNIAAHQFSQEGRKGVVTDAGDGYTSFKHGKQYVTIGNDGWHVEAVNGKPGKRVWMLKHYA
jgi:hypothetical protein